MTSPLSHAARGTIIARLAAEPLDLLVIGCGITGAGIARDAAMRGIRTGVVDQGDFGGGTSSRSSRLIHGGLRYLEHGHWRLVFEASHERRVLLDIAPHVVWPRSFLFPVHRGGRVSRVKLAAGLWLYDLLATFRNVRRHQMLGKRAILRLEPGLKSAGLRGGARYFDAQCDDARLTLANAKDAYTQGALVTNHVSADRLELADGRVRGVHLTDALTGGTFLARARVTVNATGPWSDLLRGGAADGGAKLRLTKGAHVLVPQSRLGNREAVTMTSPIDGRVMFVLPWGAFSYIGTTETPIDGATHEARATGEDVIYLLRSANAYFPEARLTPEDVIATWAAIRPLVPARDTDAPGATSREHAVFESDDGLISIVGGKLTTYRRMAAEVVDLVAQRLHEIDDRPIPPPAPTDRLPLPGGESRDRDVITDAVEAEGCLRAVAEHLAGHYGTEAPAIARLAREHGLGNRVIEDHPTIWAELLHAMQREMAVRLTDLVQRRTRLFYEAPDHAGSRIDQVADFAARTMGWDATRKAAELAGFRREVDLSDAFRRDLAVAQPGV